ncbi:MAG: hypothetical protein ACKO37_06140, partial [Vampirovibrionales bacterium]
ANLCGTDFLGALITEKSLKGAINTLYTKIPEHFTPERQGYSVSDGNFNLGVKIGPSLTTKRKRLEDPLNPCADRELQAMKEIKAKLAKLETTNPQIAEEIRAILVQHRGDFVDRRHPKQLYITMDTAQGVPLSDVYENLSRQEYKIIQDTIKEQTNLIKTHLQHTLQDRNPGNIFVAVDSDGNVKWEGGKPILQHIDYA